MNTEKKLYQWDTGQKLTGCTGLYVDFPIDNEVYRVETVDGMCIIPDELLQTSGGHKVYECMTNNTIRSFAFSVTPRPKPPDYVYTPTERLTFEGLVQKVDDAVADMIRKAESGEFDGHTPVKGTDYFTTSEIQQIQNEVSSGAIGEFKSVVDTETETFNTNAETKLNAYNQNDSQKFNAYNTNAESKLTAYNENDVAKTRAYNTNASNKVTEYNTNANNRVAEFDTHTEQIQTDISELKSDLVDLTDNLHSSLPTENVIKTLTPTIVSGKFLNKDTGEETTYASGSYAKVNVKGGEKFFVSCYVYGNSAIVFYDNNGYMSGNDITNIAGVVDYTITIPNGATTMGVSTLYTENPITVKKMVTEVSDIKEIEEIIPISKEIKNALPLKNVKADCQLDIINGKFLNKGSGNVGSYATGAYTKINVSEMEKYYVSCDIHGDFSIVFYDNDGYMNGKDISDLNAIEFYEVTVPVGAIIMGVSTVNQSTNPIAISKIDVTLMDIKPILKRNSMGGYIYPRRPMICFTLDGDYDLNQTMEEIASNHGYPLTFAIKYPSFNDTSVVEKYKLYEGKGHEIALHTYYSLWEYTDDEVIQIIKDCYDKGISCGFDIHGCIATAGSMYERFLPIVKQRFDYCASVANHAGSWEGFTTPCHDFLTSDPYKLWRYSMQQSTLEQQKSAVDDCIANNRLLMFYGHAQSQNNDYFNANNFDALLTYIDSKVATHDVEVKTNFDAIRDFYTIRYDDVIGLLNTSN